jgi:glycosyltransferase involved in cell wall biosynthesis
VIVGAGRFKLQKDFATLIDAFHIVHAERPARLVILGDGPGRRALTERIARLGLAQDVLLPGRVPNILPWLRRARLFVLSSRWEGLPGVLIEALACGCPVVSTDCPSGPAEILERGAYGTLVPVGDPQRLARAVLDALDAPAGRERLQSRARDFSSERAIPAYLAVFERVLQAQQPVLPGGH